MSASKKIFSFFVWLITTLFQIILGMVFGTIAVGMTQGKMPLSLIFSAVGLLVGIYLVGVIAIALNKSIQPKRYSLRLLLCFLGVLVPFAYLIYTGSNIGYDHPRISEGLGLQVTILAALLGIIGFNLPAWFGRKKGMKPGG
ncbi:hypothetical protein ACFLXB_00625 [Chloroflexota bacterium]